MRMCVINDGNCKRFLVKKTCMLFKYIISMELKGLKEMLGQRESSGDLCKERTGDRIQ